MLKVMRDSFKHLKWILILIVLAFVVMVFVDWGGAGAPGSVTNVSFIARVNGEVIPVQEYARTMVFTERQYEQAYGTALTPEMRQQLGLPQLVLNSLIDQKLLLQEADRLNLAATDEEVRTHIRNLPVLNPDGQFVGEELYLRFVTGNLGYPTAAAFEDEIKRELTLTKINSALQHAIVIPSARAEQEFRRRNENATIRYALYPTDRVLPGIELSPEEIEAYYRENTSRYTHPEQRNVTYLLADLARIRSQVIVPESELRARYDGARESYRQPEQISARHVLISVPEGASPEQEAAARAEAERVLALARGGTDFAELAREFSDEPNAAASGGDLGSFPRGRMVPEFEQAAFALEPGQISDLVRTSFGYHVIKVSEKVPASVRPFEQVRAELESRLVDERTRTQAREAINHARVRLEQLKPVTPETLQSVTGQVVTYNDGSWFGKTEPIQGLGRAPAVNDWAFSQARVGELGPVMETPRGPVIPYMQGERPAGVYPLTEIRARIENDARLAKARRSAAAEMKGIYDSLASLEGTASTLSLTPQEASVNRASSVQGLTGSSQALIEAAMAGKTGETLGPVVVDDGAVLFTVLDEKRYDPSSFEAQKQTLVDTMQQNEFRNLRASLIARLREQAEISINDELLRNELGLAPLAAGL